MAKFLGGAFVKGVLASPTTITYSYFDRAAAVYTFNNLIDAFLVSGMLEVTEAEFSGQVVGRFSSTVSEGNTQVVFSDGQSTIQSFGYKVFKHPRLSAYIKIEFINAQTYAGTSGNRIMVRYTVGSAITPSGFVGATQGIENVFIFASTAYSPPPYTQINSGERQLRACCGDDYFWLATAGCVLMSGITNLTQINLTAHYPSPVCPFGIAIFAGPGEDGYAVISPSYIAYNYVNSTLCSENFQNTSDSQRIAATKMRVFDGEFFVDPKGYYPGYPEPLNPTGKKGLRINQGSALIAGKRQWFDFGMVPQATVNQFDTYDLDITGHGVKPYVAINSFGTYGDCGTRLQMSTTNSIGLLFPWED